MRYLFKRIPRCAAALAICYALFFSLKTASAEGHYRVEDAKSGIVAIQTGITLSDEKFYPVKSASGFLVCNASDGVYVVTENHSVLLSEKEKKKCCKQYKISDLSGVRVSTRLIVEGDVSTNVTVLASSKKEDFCILSADDVLQERNALPLGSREDIKVGDDVYALGYSSVLDNKKKSFAGDVEIHGGAVQDTAAGIKKSEYIQHSAVITPGNSGGVLLSSDGYVIGMNNSSVVNKDVDVYYALPVDVIKAILDNYGIFYSSRERDTAYADLQQNYKECLSILSSKQYRKTSLAALEEAVRAVETVLKDNYSSMQGIEEAGKTLETAKKQIILKMSRVKIIEIVLAVILFILVVRLIYLLVLNKKIREQGKVSIRQKPDGEPGISEKPAQASDIAGKTDRNKHIILKRQMLAEYQGDETVILHNGNRSASDAVKHNARLIREKTGKSIFIDKSEFCLGKNEKTVDYVIDDNKAISREHAEIRCQYGKYYIYDLNSANGTFVNGKQEDGTGIALTSHDAVVLADERFEFLEEV